MTDFFRLVAIASVGAICTLTATGQRLFFERAGAAGIQRIHRPTMVTNLCAGGAIADFDRNGFQDIFYAAGGTDPDALFLNNGDGTFTDHAVEWGCAIAHRSTGAAPGDFDGDGWIDLYVTSHGPSDREEQGHHKLYRNLQGRGFEEVAQSMGVHWTGTSPDGWGASFGDYDGDGDLDLAVPGYRPPDGNHLFRNDGDHFTDVTASSGLAGPLRDAYGFTVKFVDMDGDLDQDLLWVSDFGSGKYFRNEGNGQFVDYTTASGTMVEDTEMGVTINDFNEDGLLDFWVTTVVENGFYINQGDNVFLEVAEASGVRDSGWGWGAVSFDWNHDTFVDMIGTSWEGHHYSFLNVSSNPEDLLFQEVHETIGFHITASGRGLSNFDYDNDGDQDLAIFTWFTNFRMYRNELPHRPGENWLRVLLDRGCSDTVAPDGIGAIVRARIGDRQQSRLMDAGSNYLSNSEFAVHFGLGAAPVVDELQIEWPDGEVTLLHDVPANQHLTVRYPVTRACFRPIDGGCAVGPFLPRLKARFDAAPVLGSMFFLDATSLPPAAPIASLLVSLSDPGTFGTSLTALGRQDCRLFASLSDVVAIPKPTIAGYAQWRFDIPAVTQLEGVEFFCQAAAIDPTFDGVGIALSNALYGACSTQ